MAHAYAQLVAEGWFEAHRGRGTSVARDLPEATLTTEPDGDEPRPRYDLRPGVPDVAGFPRDAWTAAYRRALLSAPAESLAYGDPLGHPRLRAALAAYLGRARGVHTTAGQIVICNGATHGLSMLAAALSQTRKRQRGHGVALLPDLPPGGGPAGPHRDGASPGRGGSPRGPAVADVRRRGGAHPRAPVPDRRPLSPPRRAEVLEWARATDGVVIEDDYDGEFRYDQTRIGALQADDPEHVVYLGSLSKALAPGLRLGWMAVPRRWLDPLLRVRQGSDLHPGVGEQLGLAEYIECGDFDRHLRAARLRYRRRRESLEHALTARAHPLLAPRCPRRPARPGRAARRSPDGAGGPGARVGAGPGAGRAEQVPGHRRPGRRPRRTRDRLRAPSGPCVPGRARRPARRPAP